MLGHLITTDRSIYTDLDRSLIIIVVLRVRATIVSRSHLLMTCPSRRRRGVLQESTSTLNYAMYTRTVTGGGYSPE